MVLLSRQEQAMRAQHVIAVAAVILVGFGLKLTFLSAPVAEADVGSVKSVTIDISQAHQNFRNLPVEKVRDMTSVFPGRD
jgi:hypothetical protein